MISKIRRLEITRCAEDLVRGRGPLPIDPIKLAREKGIEVRSWRPSKPGVSGFLMKQGDAFGIGYSEFINNQGFINFTVGHELGHYCLPGHVQKLFSDNSIFHYSQSGYVSHNECEKEADLFSATLLMPETLFTKELRRSGAGFRAIEALSGACMTSITATAIRFAQFSEDPVAIIVGNNGRVGFCEMSDTLRYHRGLTWLKAGDPIPESSATHKFQQRNENITTGQRTEGFTMLDEWFEGAPRVEVKEDVVGLGHYEKTLTVLFSADALSEDEEDESEPEREKGTYIPSWRRTR
jgi:hypothetical protein